MSKLSTVFLLLFVPLVLACQPADSNRPHRLPTARTETDKPGDEPNKTSDVAPVESPPIVVTQDRRYDALTWMQNSAEYSILCEQTYRLAASQLMMAAQDPNWCGDEVQAQAGDFQTKPPAVILDVDETVLDNSVYNARNIASGTHYNRDSWNAWCSEKKASAIPGALDFTRTAEAIGVQVFFVTNRRDVVKAATVENLQSLGFNASDENVLTQNPDEGRGGNKISRRAAVAENFRIAMLIGDSMSDLCSGMDPKTSDERTQIAREKSHVFGTRWFIMPNPVYGGWQRVIGNGPDALRLQGTVATAAPDEPSGDDPSDDAVQDDIADDDVADNEVTEENAGDEKVEADAGDQDKSDAVSESSEKSSGVPAS